MYGIQLIIIYQYLIVSLFRAWIAKEENKISRVSFIAYSCVFIYLGLSGVIFSTVFAVKPDLTTPHTMRIHTLPFTNLIIALACLQISVTWFGVRVSWTELNAPKWLRIGTYICLIGLIITSTIKVVHHINALSDLGDKETGVATGEGLWWSVHEYTLKKVFQAVDACWMLFALVGPMCQSAYLGWRKFDTHGVIFIVRDNRRSNITNEIHEDGMENIPEMKVLLEEKDTNF